MIPVAGPDSAYNQNIRKGSQSVSKRRTRTSWAMHFPFRSMTSLLILLFHLVLVAFGDFHFNLMNLYPDKPTKMKNNLYFPFPLLFYQKKNPNLKPPASSPTTPHISPHCQNPNTQPNRSSFSTKYPYRHKIIRDKSIRLHFLHTN